MSKLLRTEKVVRNGVRVTRRVFEGGTTVDAECKCYGYDFRVHSRADCPNRLRLIEGRA